MRDDHPTPVPGLDEGLRLFFGEFVRVSLRHPTRAWHFVRVALWQRAASRRRARQAAQGLHVPPIAILSVTNRCNLHCKGCYAQALRHDDAPDALTGEHLRSIVGQGEALGIGFFVLAGGEPLTRPDVLDLTRRFPRVLFLLVTNGLLLDDAMILRLARQRNTVPVLSLEGDEAQTDDRRGRGVHQRLQRRMNELRAAGVFFAVSLTVTRTNFDVVADPAFVERAVALGCRLFLFLEYTPLTDGADPWTLTDTQRREMKGRVAAFRATFSAVFIAVPWDEDEVGGCLAAGRGFVHINATGDLEPCPFAPWSDTNLKATPLATALRSRFLATLRREHASFGETDGGCALWRHRDAVQAMLRADDEGDSRGSA